MSKGNIFLEAAKNVERIKEELEQAYETLNLTMLDLGMGTYLQDSETKLVYKIVKPKGQFIKYKDIDYARTAKEGERQGSLGKKEAEQQGFSLE